MRIFITCKINEIKFLTEFRGFTVFVELSEFLLKGLGRKVTKYKLGLAHFESVGWNKCTIQQKMVHDIQ